MKTLVFGSLNIDHIYTLPHSLRPGETLSSAGYSCLPGGKGLNQAVALSRAGAAPFFAGAIGPEGDMLLSTLQNAEVDTRFVRRLSHPTGHAIIYVSADGGNSIVLYGGTNRQIDEEMIDGVLEHFSKGDCLLVQNEISCCETLFRHAKRRGMLVAVNPSPADETLKNWPLEMADWLIFNEVEGEDLTGETDPEAILASLAQRCKDTALLLTLGKDGSIYRRGDTRYVQPAFSVKAVDTTAAGDTFTGFFLARMMRDGDAKKALLEASAAAALAVTRPGASPSIPTREEMEAFLAAQNHS